MRPAHPLDAPPPPDHGTGARRASDGRTSGVAEVAGARLAYEVSGTGPPVVLVHAGIADGRMWDGQVEALAGDFTVVRYDARGFGRSPLPAAPFSRHGDLAALLGHLGIGRAHLVGCSMGGTTVLDAALAYPGLAASLTLVGARPSGTPPSAALREAWIAADGLAEAGDIAGAIERELRMWVDGPGQPAGRVDPAVRELVRRMEVDAFAWWDIEAEEIPLEPPAAGRLGEVAVPTLVAVGDLDWPDMVEAAAAMATGIPGARHATLRRTAHLPNLEQPAAFDALVGGFLRSLPPL